MARKVEIAGAESVKVISPWVAFLLAFVTLGIYYVVWYGIRNSELNDYGATLVRGPQDKNALKVSGFGAIIAIVIGGIFIIPPFISQWRFSKRIARAEGLLGIENRVNAPLGTFLLLLGYFFIPIEIVYFQRHLNRVWDRVELARTAGP